MFSCISEKPGPLVAVIDFEPAQAAPMIPEMLASSSSNCTNLPPTRGSMFDMVSAISDAGVMGYAPKKSQPP